MEVIIPRYFNDILNQERDKKKKKKKNPASR